MDKRPEVQEQNRFYRIRKIGGYSENMEAGPRGRYQKVTQISVFEGFFLFKVSE
jgi:hypothetical protein